MSERPSSVPFALERLGVVMQADPSIPEEVEGVLNPAAARGPDGELYLFPRIVGKGNYSRVGIARVRFSATGDPVGVQRLGYALEPSEPYELRPDDGTGGCEDPRVTFVEPLQTYVMTYTALGPTGPRVALAVSQDLFEWRRLGVVELDPEPNPVYGVDFDVYHNKDAAFFPQVVTAPDGRLSLALIHRPVYTEEDVPRGVTDVRPSIWISYTTLEDARRDLQALTRLHNHRPVIDPEFEWESLRIGGGTPPVLTPFGWLMIFHGASGTIPTDPSVPKDVRYVAGALVVDREEPGKVVYRSGQPILEPATAEEITGIVSNVVFPTGIDDRSGGRYNVYYGMADERIGVARLVLPSTLPM